MVPAFSRDTDAGLEAVVLPPHDPLLTLSEIRRRSPTVAALQRGPWAVFQAIAQVMRRNASAYPSQDTLARSTGYDARSVGRYTCELRAAGLIVTRRTGRTDVLVYAWGPAAAAAFADFEARFPRDLPRPRAKALGLASRPDTMSTRRPDTMSDKQEIRSEQTFSCEGPSTSTPGATEKEVTPMAPPERPIETTAEDREVAVEGLRALALARRPGAPVPRWFDGPSIALLAGRVGELPGERPARVEAVLAAVRGAVLASRDRPPTVIFLAGSTDHFLAHVDRGRAELAREERERTAHEARRRAAEARRDNPAPSPAPTRRGPNVAGCDVAAAAAGAAAIAALFGAGPTPEPEAVDARAWERAEYARLELATKLSTRQTEEHP